MSLKSAGLAACSCFLVAAASAAVQEPTEGLAEAPVAIDGINGEWTYHDSTSGPLQATRSPTLSYQGQFLPRLTHPLISVTCMFDGMTRVEVTGLIPAQSFPQPAVSLGVGDRRWSATPSAIYSPRSQPRPAANIPDSKLDDNLKGRDLSWPGHPPYASLRFVTPRENPLAPAFAAGAEVQVEFEGQRRRFPAVPAEMPERFVRACAAVRPFG